MRILHLGKYYHPRIGGIETVIQQLAEEFIKIGHFVQVQCFDNKNEIVQINGVIIERCKTMVTILSQPISIKYIINTLKIINSFDIIHIHLPNYLAIIIQILSKKNNKIIVHWHSDINNKRIIKSIFGFLVHYSLSKCDSIICTSYNYAQSSHDLKKYISKITVIPIGIRHFDEQLNKLTKEEIDILNKISVCIGNSKLIIGVGRLVHYKGFRYLIEAAELINNDNVIFIIGDGPEKAYLKDLIDSKKLNSKVKLLGNLSDTLKNRLIAKADILCLPSINRSEAFGVVIIEALQKGIPVISTFIPGSGTSFVNIHMETGINVEIMNSIEIAKAIQLISSQNEFRENLSINAKVRYENLFTLNKFVKNVEKLYYKVW
jgi:glycosyltransferase involved in cell wall biosynthesis